MLTNLETYGFTYLDCIPKDPDVPAIETVKSFVEGLEQDFELIVYQFNRKRRVNFSEIFIYARPD